MNKLIILLIALICHSVHADSLYVWENVDDKEFLQILDAHPAPEKIEEISVDSDPDVTPKKALSDASLQAIGERCPALKYFETCGNRLTDEGISSLAAGCPALEVLDITVSANRKGRVTDIGVIKLSQSCPLLRDLSLTGHTDISDKGIVALVINCPHLSDLSATGNGKKVIGKLTDQSLFALAEYSASLKSLDISQNSGITYDGAKALLKSVRSLEELCIDYTSISKEEYKKLRKLRPEVYIDWCD